MNHATRAFFRSGHGVVLAVYDTRRGQVEGREAEKILAFYPPTATAAMQSSIVGLAQALTMFAGTFNKECPFHSMEAQGHVWTMYHAEPDLWLLLVAGRALLGPDCLASSLSGLLKGLHSVMALLHGLLSTQLEEDASGARVRRRLQPLLQEAAGSLLQPDPAGLWSISCPLGLTGGVPLLPVSAAAFTRMQSLTNSLLAARLFSCRPVLGVLLAWQTCLLWSSLGSADTATLHSLVVRGLEPAVRQSSHRQHKGVRWPLAGSSSATGSSSAAAAQGQQHSPLPSPSSSSSGSVLHADCICLASPGCWQCWPNGLVLPVGCAALHQASASLSGAAASSSASASSSGREGLPVSSSAGSGGGGGSGGDRAGAGAFDGSELPVVWLQSGCERARLLAWHSGPLLVLVLLEDSGPPVTSCAAVIASLLELLRAPGSGLAAQLGGELPAKHLWHVQGLRYLYQDHLSAAVRASPLRKVATLAQPSLHLAADARRWASLEAAAAADPTAAVLGVPPQAAGALAEGAAAEGGGGGSATLAEQWESFAAGGCDADVEVVVRGGTDCWVVGRHTAAGRQLTAVVEGDKDRGLLGVVRRVQEFCDSQVPGVFDASY